MPTEAETKIVVDIKDTVRKLQDLLNEASAMHIDARLNILEVGTPGERFPRRLLELTLSRQLD